MKLFDANDLRRERIPAAPPVKVNGEEIPSDAIAREIQHHPAPDALAARAAATEALAIRALLLQEAKRLGVKPAPETAGAGRRETDEDSQIRQLLEMEVTLPKPTGAECRRFFDMNRDRFENPFEEVEAMIADYLSDRVFHRAVAQYIAILAARAELEGVTLNAATSPLVQ